MPITLETVVSQSPDYLTADVKDEAVAMSIANGRYIALNPMAKEIWNLAATPRRVADICAMLSESYSAQPGEIEVDVAAFVDQMTEAGLLLTAGA